MSRLSVLADPTINYVDGSTYDYLHIELVNALRTSSAFATARTKRIEAEMIQAGLLPPVPPAKEPPTTTTATNARDSTASLASIKSVVSASGKDKDKDEAEEALRMRLESIGVHTGANLAERLCRDKPPFAETLDAVKFICKDIWAACWDKQVDNLRTNHRGVYVLQDNAFKPLLRLSSYESRADALRRAKIYTAIPTGIIKGALQRLGYTNVSVVSELTSLPQCTFQVKLPRNT